MAWRALVRSRIYYLGEVPFSPHFLRGSALLWRLRIELLLLHRVVLGAVVDGQFVETTTCLSILSGAYGLRLAKTVICLIVIILDSLNLPLVIET